MSVIKICRYLYIFLILIFFFFYRESRGDQITLFFDMVDTGLSNIDMDLTKYLISLFKHYYPNFLNLILILEMPWILNAAFSIIKSWLPARAISKIKMVKKSNLKDYVDLDDALKSWGGNNDYSFVFVPETPQRAQVNGNIDKKVFTFKILTKPNHTTLGRLPTIL